MCAQQRLRSAWASAQSDQSLLSTWRKLGSLDTQWVHSEDSDQTGHMPRQIWVFAGCTCHFVMRWSNMIVLNLCLFSFESAFVHCKMFCTLCNKWQKPVWFCLGCSTRWCENYCAEISTSVLNFLCQFTSSIASGRYIISLDSHILSINHCVQLVILIIIHISPIAIL